MALSPEELDKQIKMVGDNAQIKLKNIRLRFGNPLVVRENESTDNGKPVVRYTYEGVFLLNEVEDADQIALVKRAIAKVIALKFPNQRAAVRPENRCLQSAMIREQNPETGEEELVERYAGTEGNMMLTARAYCRKGTENPVQVIGPKKTLVRGVRQWVQLDPDKDQDLIYAGCYCNLVVRIYGLVGDPKKQTVNRVSCSLEIVQHSGHGDAFSAPRANADDLMDEEEVEEDDLGEALGDDDLGAAASDTGEDWDV